jgi:predicted TIM-barrel fold metal-dependent hydrolase
MADIPIVDAHHHLWDLETNSYPWLVNPPSKHITGDLRPLGKSYTIEDFKADIAGQNVIKSVHIECHMRPDDPVLESEWLTGVAEKHGYPHAFVVHVPLQRPDAQETIERHLQYPNVRSVRHMLLWHPDTFKTFFESDLLRSHDWRRGFALLSRYGLTFDLAVYSNQMEDAAELAARHPETQIILLHAGMPVDRDAEGWQRWRAGMKELAKRDNLSVKISGWGMVDHAWGGDAERERPFVLETIEIFGAHRAMFASNFPVDKLSSSYAAIWNAFRKLTASFSDDERHALFHANAERFYRI